jgi:hypothetical protein|tara:strand:- start:2116 stop:2334 length:219 start_codon:yes stop_codon:yes gene_type:complete
MNYWKKFVEFLVGPGDGVRAKDSKGRYIADDKSTVDVNEAYKDGKKPKTRAKKKAPKKKGRGRPKGSKNKKK